MWYIFYLSIYVSFEYILFIKIRNFYIKVETFIQKVWTYFILKKINLDSEHYNYYSLSLDA